MKRFGAFILVFVAAFCLSASACSKTNVTSPVLTVCQEVPGPSLLEQYIPDLSTANMLFKLAVLEVGRLDVVRQKDIAKILDEAEALVTTGTTYDGMVMYLLPKFKWIRDNCGAEVVIISSSFMSLQGIKTPIEPKDVCYIKAHIADQRKTVLPWIKKQV